MTFIIAACLTAIGLFILVRFHVRVRIDVRRACEHPPYVPSPFEIIILRIMERGRAMSEERLLKRLRQRIPVPDDILLINLEQLVDHGLVQCFTPDLSLMRAHCRSLPPPVCYRCTALGTAALRLHDVGPSSSRSDAS